MSNDCLILVILKILKIVFFCKFFYAEINRVRNHLFNILSRPKVNLPTAEGEKKIYEEKIFIPTQLYPDVSSL